MVSKDPDYHSKYYQKHKDEILRRRKERYREDPEYQRRVFERASKRSKKNTEIRRLKRRASEPKWFVLSIDGKEIKVLMYTLKHLSKALDKSVRTLYGWEERGILPPALYRDTSSNCGIRLYPEFQFNEILRIYAEVMFLETSRKLSNRIGSTDFPRRMSELWRRYPRGIDLRKV